MLESVQRRPTEIIPLLKNLSYENRLKKLNMYSLERRYKRGDMIEVYKIFNGLDDLNMEDYIDLDTNNITKEHNFKIKEKSCKLDMRKNFFSLRVVNQWNGLPADVVNSPTLSTFKSRLDKFMNRSD